MKHSQKPTDISYESVQDDLGSDFCTISAHSIPTGSIRMPSDWIFIGDCSNGKTGNRLTENDSLMRFISRPRSQMRSRLFGGRTILGVANPTSAYRTTPAKLAEDQIENDKV